MLSISTPLSATSVSKYFRTELSAANSSYYAENKELRGNFYGALTETLGLKDQQVKAETFDRLALGQHPITGEQLIKHRDTMKTKEGKELGHRAGWDLTFSADKSMSIAALVGGDTRIVDAHRAAVKSALAMAEELIQARMGGARPAETTGKFLVATFDHDTARPVDGYAAAQLHTHGIVFNMTESPDGQARSIQSHELYVASGLLTAEYRNQMHAALAKMGYEIRRNPQNKSVEIVGFTEEYLASESKRSAEIQKEIKDKGMTDSAAARYYAAHSTRGSKLNQTPEEVKAAHQENSAKFGHQAHKVVAEAALRKGMERSYDPNEWARRAVNYARVKLSERDAVFEQHQVLTEALNYARGRTDLPAIRTELNNQKQAGKFIAVDHVRPSVPLERYTTLELIKDERTVLQIVRENQRQVLPVNRMTDELIAGNYPMMNPHQRIVIREVLSAEDRITGIQGSAGTGKTTLLAAIREKAEASGWKVVGLGPTSQAAKGLREAGVTKSQTLQSFLLRHMAVPYTKEPRLFFVDESSLTAARQMNQLITFLGPRDRVVLVGDRRQHQSVEAGQIFKELQLAGMKTARINKLVRQKPEELKEVVKAMAQGRTVDGVKLLGEQGRIHEIPHRGERFAAVAAAYVALSGDKLVLSPDNLSREQLSVTIREALRGAGQLGADKVPANILVNRQNITGADLRIAGTYSQGDVLFYRKGNSALKQKSYATVLSTDQERNTVTVQRPDGKRVTYDPARLRGVSVYEPREIQIAEGDRLQFTAPDKKISVTNRDMGTVVSADKAGNVKVRLDEGRAVEFNLKQNRHIDYAYAMTSHSAQGKTVDRVLVHMDAGDTRLRSLVNDTFAYVATSRPRYDVQIFTDNTEALGLALARHKENSMALSPEQIHQYKTGLAA